LNSRALHAGTALPAQSFRRRKNLICQLLGHPRLALSRVTEKRLGLRKSRISRGITGKLRIHVGLVGRRLLLANKFSDKGRNVSLDSHTAIGLSLLLMPRTPAAAEKLSQTSKTLSKRLTPASD
jgi:hypothetical protein